MGEQIWILGIMDNNSKDFRLEAVKQRNSETLKTFILNNIECGNKIISDGWNGYTFINDLNVYDWEIHNHGAGDFGFDFTHRIIMEPTQIINKKNV